MLNAREKAGRSVDIPPDELGNRSLKQGLPDDNLSKRTQKRGDLLAECRLIWSLRSRLLPWVVPAGRHGDIRWLPC